MYNKTLIAVWGIVTMMMMMMTGSSEALSVVPKTTGNAQNSFTSLDAVTGRRTFFMDTSSSVMAVASLLVAAPTASFADDLGDLSMPSEDEIKKAEADAMAERLRKKAELKKQAAKPISFQESMEAEKKKQDQLKKSKEERRIALCEELGRGC